MERTCVLLSVILLLVHSCCITIDLVAATETNMITDQSALLALKSHITSDPLNILTTNWSSTTPSNSICNWVGVTCGASDFRVRALNLSYMGLTGTIPPHLGNLSFLVDLDFRNNSFSGTLPQELSHLRRLKFINFGFNKFMGTIPSWFRSLSKLQILNLSGNQFSGSVASAFFNLSALQVINLSYNQLTGSLPREVGNLTMLKLIDLTFNNFIEIPNVIGSKDRLEKLLVQANALKGPVPVTLFNMSSLTTLSLARNSLSGGIPDNICQHLPRIQGLNFGENQFDGPMPSKLWQCKELRALLLNTNNFSGSLPKTIGNLTKLTELYFGKNNWTGTIPDEIGGLQNLQILTLQVTNLHGLIPPPIFNLSSVILISLADNQLSGSLPANIGLGVPNLQQLYIGINNLHGVIPNFTSIASNLRELDMAENSFSGFIPTTLCTLTNIQWLNLNKNNLNIDPEANILSCLPNLTNLMTFYMADNPLNAMLPVSFGNLSTSLEYLDLSNCKLRGYIPNDIGNISSMISLGMGHNQLKGTIPKTTGSLQNLQGLGLNENKLQGDIPYELCQLDNLFELLLGGNRLSGSIPSCLGNLSASLRILSLGSNLLSSKIPSTLWGLQDILSLNLSSNLLNGSLSEDIGRLKVVTNVDLSNNHLSGHIPTNIGGLKDLVNLSLANNKLQGPIPTSCGNLLSLELLDLSVNNLVEVIPKSLQALLHLKFLNLSFNKLQGEIPSGGPFQNFSALSFVSNGPLCGVARFLVPPCKNSTQLEPNWRKAKYIIPGIISAILLVSTVTILILRKKKNIDVATETALLHLLFWRRVSHLQLIRATDAFNENNLLGSGAFGSVYKGTISDEGEVAVKVFNLQLEGAFKSFESECEVLSNIRHRNLIKIISCCSELDFKALVMQYMANGSLEKWLYSHNCSLNTLQRLNIMIDVASALEYLHHGHGHEHVVHCDLKPSNILLDNDMVAHVADFGMAKLLGEGDSMIHTMTLATIGYMAPEFGIKGIVSTRGDVYSFGIVLMETFTRRKPTDEIFIGEMNLKQWISNSLITDGASVEVVDANLLGTEEDPDFVSKRDSLSSIMRLAVACSAEFPEDRINMQDAAVALNKIKIKFLKDGGLMPS